MGIIKYKNYIIGLFFLFSILVVAEPADSEFLTLSTTPEKEVINTEPVSLFFVGDIMLGRVVENIIERQGFMYPFEDVVELIEEADVAIGNFEGIVNTTHKKTAPYAFQFSVKEEYLKELGLLGFDILSLANNHADDFGIQGLKNTRHLCLENNIFCVGDPYDLNQYSSGFQEVNGIVVSYIFLHTLENTPDFDQLKTVVELLDKNSDFVVAYVHWGTEYELIHNAHQEKLAYALIESGVDAVIGHHPHVVQDVEIYKNKPIFYSLGNFVFDQYFSNDVQEGIGVSVTIQKPTVEYKIIGLSGKESQSQPRIMNDSDSTRLLERIMGEVKQNDKGVFTLNYI